jgi:hypothetical protein
MIQKGFNILENSFDHNSTLGNGIGILKNL